MKNFLVKIKMTSFLKKNISSGRNSGKEFAVKTKKAIESGMRKIGGEAKETREMARSFFKLLESKLDMENRTEPPSEEELREAIEQLKDVGRFSVFTTAIILPGGALSLIGLEMLARRFGIKITFIPSSFRKNADWKYPKGIKKEGFELQKSRKGKITDVKPLDENID